MKFSVLVVLALVAPLPTTTGEDLYKLLGVSRSASPSQIKTAYRRMAKEWHPDKNKAPEAKDKFIAISTAYEVLSDEEKRSRYDLTGRVEDSQPLHRSHSTHQGFTVFQSGNGFQFHFNFPGGGGRRQKDDAISFRDFSGSILPGSHQKPYLLYFHSEFCFECMRLDSVWTQLRNDLTSLGVGMATVHSSRHPQVAQYCSVSRVPTIVGMVSGRTTHFNGWMYDPRNVKNFVKSILPDHVITKLTESNMEQFLADVIPRNRPRVILFSRSPTPSLVYHLTAFYLRGGLDFAHVPTIGGELERGVGRRFGVRAGEKKIMAFKEDHKAVLVQPMFELSRDQLLSLVEGMTLYLPRLSSPTLLDKSCPFNELCAVLVVDGVSEYNDSMTSAFREMAKRGSGGAVSFAYIDGSLQEEFLSNFGWNKAHVRCKNSQEMAKKVLLLRRVSRTVQFKWIDEFCGQPLDDLSVAYFSGTKMAALKKQLVDEEAPGWFGRQWNALVDYYYSFTSAVNMNMESFSLLLSLLFAAMLMCLIGVLSGAREEDKEEGSTHRHHRKAHHRKAEKQIANGSLHIHYLTSEGYDSCVLNPDKGIVTLLILVDNTTQHYQQLLRAYGKVLSKHRYGNLRLFYLCYQSNRAWFEELLLARTSTLDQEEARWRVRGCVSGRVATAMVLFGGKQQLLLFPEKFEVVRKMCEEDGGQRERMEAGDSSLGLSSLRKEATEDRTRGVKNKSVGKILGDTLGYEESSDEASSSEEDTSQLDREREHHGSKPLTHGKPGDGGMSPHPTSGHAHKLHPPGGIEESHMALIEQVCSGFETWCERLADGSLRRHRVEAWPQLRDT